MLITDLADRRKYMVRRAQPFPAFPPDMEQASMSFSVPIQFSVR